MTNHQVLIAGAGPTGMMLAAELQLAGVDVAVVERRATPDLAGSRAGGLHARTIEILDQRGVADRFIAEGQKFPVVHFHGPLDISDFPTRHPYTLALWQNHIERILAGWIVELGVTVYRGIDVTGATQDADGVTIESTDGKRLRGAYLVGCDGGRSVVRKSAGIDFPGWDPTTSWLIAEVQMTQEPQFGFKEDEVGSHAIGKGDGGIIRMALTEPVVGTTTEPSMADVRDSLVRIYGTDFGAHSPLWISRFTDMTRQAAAYRSGRILLAGDAAHVHPPLGGQGLNIGVHDAVNLGWKLAQVVTGRSADTLLDTYHAERHPLAARVLKNTMAHVLLRRTDPRTKALGEYVSEFLAVPETRKKMAGEMTGLGIRYDLGEGHPLLGRRMPDLDLVTDDDSITVYSLLHDGRAVLLNLGEPGALDGAPASDRVQLVDAGYAGPWELPVIGAVPAPTSMLIRPDGHVAWVGDGSTTGLDEALSKWFGATRR